MSVFRCLYVQIAIALLLLSSTEASANANNTFGCIASERSALVHFKAGLSDPQDLLSSWHGDDCCRWKGVHCSKRTGHVMKLDLQGSSYDMGSNVMMLQLGGNISSSLLGLQRLRLTGEIPREIGALVALKSLDLSWNAFSAKIPETIGSLVQVESLDLSHNKLSGEIPTSLSDLTSLSHLNLSYNNLTGEVPYGNQLQTFDDQSIYVGNPGLCGPFLRKCLGNESIPAAPERHEDGNNMVSFFIAMDSGCVMGLWVVFCTFLFKRKWRICWFSFYDNLCDRVYVLVAVSWAYWTRKDG